MPGVTDVLPTSYGADPETLKRDVEALNRLVQVSLVLNSTLEIDKLLQFIMDAAAGITDAEGASILLVDKNTNQLQFAASTGADIKQLRNIVVPLEGSIAGTVLTEDRAIIIDDTRREPRHFSQVGQSVQVDIRSLVGVPMRIKDSAIGVLEAVNKKGEAGHFDNEDVRRLTILAALAAVAIENVRLVEALQRAYDDLGKVDKLKSDFIAIASHELRTPLSVILGYASFLKEESRGAASEHAEAVLSSALRIRSVIEDMTNLRFVQVEEAELNLEPVTLNSIMREAQQEVSELAEAKEQALLVDVPVEQIEICADRIKLELALINVLNNAVKFTPEGGIIAVQAMTKPGEVWVSVKDNGIGLEADQQERIFDQFYQVEDHMTRRHGGLGLGLTIAKAIVERHDGRIWVESEGLDRGSTFYISIPTSRP